MQRLTEVAQHNVGHALPKGPWEKAGLKHQAGLWREVEEAEAEEEDK